MRTTDLTKLISVYNTIFIIMIFIMVSIVWKTGYTLKTSDPLPIWPQRVGRILESMGDGFMGVGIHCIGDVPGTHKVNRSLKKRIKNQWLQEGYIPTRIPPTSGDLVKAKQLRKFRSFTRIVSPRRDLIR